MLDQFAVKTSIFTPLFERFVQNWRQPRRYLITLRDGESRVGIPLAHTYASPEAPDSFLLTWEEGTFVAVPFSDLDRVEEIMGDAPVWALGLVNRRALRQVSGLSRRRAVWSAPGSANRALLW
jgi:hypothetical protein